MSLMKYLLYFVIFGIVIVQETKLVIVLTSNENTTPILNSDSVDVLGESWNENNTGLNNIGYRQSFLYGLEIRNTYKNFLSLDYNPKEFYAKSIDDDAALLSGNSFLQGFFYETNEMSLNKWQLDHSHPTIYHNYGIDDSLLEEDKHPIPKNIRIYPLHSFSRKNKNNYFLYNSCSKLNKATNEKIAVLNKNYMAKISSQQSIKQFESNLYDYFNTILIDYYNEKELYLIKNKENIIKIASEYLREYYLLLLSKDNNYLTVHLFIRELLLYFKTKIENKNFRKFIYLSIDRPSLISIAYFFISLNNQNAQLDFDYNRFYSINFELVQKGIGKNRKINESDYEILVKVNENTSIFIDYNDLKQAVSSFEMSREQLDEFCGIEKEINLTKKFKKYKYSFIFITLVLYLTAILTLLYLIYYSCYRSNDSYILEMKEVKGYDSVELNQRDDTLDIMID